MKERPLLFSGPMVRAILDGHKTQTRRVMKSRWFKLEMCNTSNPPHLRYNEFRCDKYQGLYESGSGPFDPRKASDQEYAATFCPYGQPGDRLWVRETFQICSCIDGEVGYPFPKIPKQPVGCVFYKATDDDPDEQQWRPSIHMPRWASRITLKIVGVRVERLQEISVADVISEGVRTGTGAGMIEGETTFQFTTSNLYGRGKVGAVAAFQDLVESIHGKGFWSKNPWVWVITFKRETGNAN